MKKFALFASLLIFLILAGGVSAQETKKYKIGALTKSLANPYFLRMKESVLWKTLALDMTQALEFELPQTVP